MWTMFARLLIAVLLLTTLSFAVTAQSSTRETGDGEISALMTPGAYVRVKLPGEHAWMGRLVSVSGDSMLVRGTSGSDTTDNFCFFCDYVPPSNPPITDHATAGTLVGGLAGGALGLLVSRHRSHDWRPVSTTRRRTAVTLSPKGGRVAIAF